MSLLKKFSPLLLLFPTMAVILVYVFIVSHTGVMGYELSEKQLQLGRLKEQVKELDIKASELSALPRVQELSQQLGLSAHGPVEYLNPTPAVAVK
ncbi:MAG: hypothetical protein NTV81_03675 [Candidatus Komeilibacteria bacterium]|nr:hypothetical protein [Candidatus Komeilibacteria bacterium]